MEVTEKGGRRRKQLLDDLKEREILEIERENTRSHSVKNSLWKSFGPVVRRTAEW